MSRSVSTIAWVDCDMCGFSQEFEIDPYYDVQEEVEEVMMRDGWGVEVETIQNFYHDLCEDCYYQLQRCEWCENEDLAHQDYSVFCGDVMFLEDHPECLKDAHDQWAREDDEFNQPECPDCGYDRREGFRFYEHQVKPKIKLKESA